MLCISLKPLVFNKHFHNNSELKLKFPLFPLSFSEPK